MPRMPHDKNNRLDLDGAKDIRDGDELHNLNCYEYLKNIADVIPAATTANPLASLRNFFNKYPHYRPRVAYGNLYTNFLLKLEKNIENLQQERQTEREQLEADLALAKARLAQAESLGAEYKDSHAGRLFIQSYQDSIKRCEARIQQHAEMIDRIYANPNQALERAAEMVKSVLERPHRDSAKVEEEIRERMLGKSSSVFGKFANKLNYALGHRDRNKTNPQQEGSNLGRLSSMLSRNFKPQMTTSLASVRDYAYKKSFALPVELRFGTQGQFHKGVARVSPLFELWLKTQAEKFPAQTEQRKVTHIYFNNLARDRIDYEGRREKKLTHQLEELEQRHPNVAVITLPADKGLLNYSLTRKHHKAMSYQDAFNTIRDITTGQSFGQIQDFYISPAIKQLLYPAGSENAVVEALLKMSFKKLGLAEARELSYAEIQAVYFHFIKFELTRYIIDTLQPASFNMSCKDAIDRGGVSSAYYNLLQSIESGSPMSRAEFERALHAAPTLVKGRGMNHHIDIIWNAINCYIHGCQKNGMHIEPWLLEWHAENTPKKSKEYFIKKLVDYISHREQGPLRYSVFAKFVSEEKVSAANKLLGIISHPEQPIVLTENEWGALQEGRLRKIFVEAEKHGLFKSNDLKPQHAAEQGVKPNQTS
jgi:hypothetical protein